MKISDPKLKIKKRTCPTSILAFFLFFYRTGTGWSTSFVGTRFGSRVNIFWANIRLAPEEGPDQQDESGSGRARHDENEDDDDGAGAGAKVQPKLYRARVIKGGNTSPENSLA